MAKGHCERPEWTEELYSPEWDCPLDNPEWDDWETSCGICEWWREDEDE